jgi:NAD(P)-dependent dehydrogenase (short-subunit alcohol dehydrogenase family)
MGCLGTLQGIRLEARGLNSWEDRNMSQTKSREIVVVTGASAGVGRATVQAFARQGARIGLVARGRAGLEGARHDVEALGGEALALPTDVADPDQVERAAAAVENTWGPIDIWVNDAFCSVFSPAKQMTPADYKRVTEVTYLGFVHGTLAALKRMLPRDHGVIVQVGSALAYRGIPLQSAYCAAKHAIQGFTESVRCELIHDRSNVKITMVKMPALNTPQFTWSKSRMPRKAQPVPPIFQPEVAADAIVWASHHYRREWFVGGSTAVVITGNKIAPGYGDHYLAKNGYESQMHDGQEDPNRPNNLYKPVDEDRDFGAHGEFDDRSLSHSYQLWLDQRRDWIAVAGVVGGLCAALRGGPGKFWRSGLIGLAAGALGAVGLAALARPDRGSGNGEAAPDLQVPEHGEVHAHG